MKLETQRLLLVPLDARQLRLWIENISELERELGCSYRAEPLTGEFLNIVQGQLEIVERNETNALFHTFWQIVRKEDGVVVGSADFKNGPDQNGEVEIGYGLGDEHRGHGYMTEAVAAMCRWVLAQPGIAHVIAETERDNLPSQRVLERCGFTQYWKGNTLWWKL